MYLPSALIQQAGPTMVVSALSIKMKYAYYDLYPQQFEKLVVAICQSLLGVGVQEFSTGPDGGRDARFEGTANCFPSEKSPLVGKTIVQAKHTSAILEKFSDPSFSGDSKSSVLSEELPRIRKLKEKGELEHYILFSNRALGAQAEENIRARILKEASVTSSHMVGVEGLERYLKTYPQAAALANLDPMESPLRVSPDRIAEVIVALAKDISKLSLPAATAIERTGFDRKNQINGLSPEYANVIKKQIKYFDLVRDFLAHPENTELLVAYEDSVEEFKTKIIAHRFEYATFDNVLNYVLDRLFERDVDLRQNPRLTRTIIYYMYWNCDIGIEHVAAADETQQA
jgi:hypothetical protein